MKHLSLPRLAFATCILLSAGAFALGDTDVVGGLKDALRIGTERAVARTSAAGGFLDNPKIRIPLPGALETAGKTLRAVGMGAKVDELEVSMNRAAESASAEAKPIFWDALTSMSFSDAQGILSGGDTAATQYFRKTTGNALSERFRPVVETAMRTTGVYQSYETTLASYKKLPLASSVNLDLPDYVTTQAIDGLFKVLGQEERRIRKDPVARTTDLLKLVFGK